MLRWVALLFASGLFVLSVPGSANTAEVAIGARYWANPASDLAFNAALHDQPNGKLLNSFSKSRGGRFEVTEVSDGWAKIRFDDGEEAWILSSYLQNSTVVLTEDPKVTRERLRREKARADAARIARDAKIEAAERAKRDAIIDAQPWSQEIKGIVRARKIEKGMVPEMVKLSMGEPIRIIETNVGTVKEERWIYSGGTILLFHNDKLIGWQRER